MGQVNSVEQTYHDECRMVRMHLVDLLSRPAFGHRSWSCTLKIGRALIELDRQADSMDREAQIGRYRQRPSEDSCAPNQPTDHG